MQRPGFSSWATIHTMSKQNKQLNPCEVALSNTAPEGAFFTTTELMKTYVISNFVDRDPLYLQIVKSVAPAVIMLTQRAGSSNFQHAITETQAREMADALIEMSNLLKQINP